MSGAFTKAALCKGVRPSSFVNDTSAPLDNSSCETAEHDVTWQMYAGSSWVSNKNSKRQNQNLDALCVSRSSSVEQLFIDVDTRLSFSLYAIVLFRRQNRVNRFPHKASDGALVRSISHSVLCSSFKEEVLLTLGDNWAHILESSKNKHRGFCATASFCQASG